MENERIITGEKLWFIREAKKLFKEGESLEVDRLRWEVATGFSTTIIEEDEVVLFVFNKDKPVTVVPKKHE